MSTFTPLMADRKILIVTNRVPYPLRDGGNLAMHAMIEGYHRAGWQVYLLAMNTIRHKVSANQLKTLYKDIHAFNWVDIDNSVTNGKIIKNYLFSRTPEHVERFYRPEFEDKLIEALNEFRPDCVQIESVYLSTYLPAIKKYSTAVTILRLHNLEYQIWASLSRKRGNALKQFYLNSLATRVRKYEREVWKKYDLLIPITEKDASQVIMLETVKDIIVAPFSIDVQKVPVNTVTEEWVGYHLGAMDWLANQDAIRWFIDEIWPRVRKAVPDFRFYFAGRNMPDEFKDYNNAGIYGLNEVPDAAEFIADKKILIVPLRSGGGIRVKIMEAMAAGKVIIATPVAIKGIEAKTGEHYLQARRPQDFAKAIKWCMDNKSEAQAIADNARAMVRSKYDHSTVIGNVINELERILESRKG